ncbi:AbrB/MazE/SpoVT family DNA-binding domain-containing protein [Candidatus Woesearchaeota archaeon]|nr:AbrB/MazE/SpoVT family DNA-binding domain-containing protein [Candidatus Woesearchaeota archaeon]
MEVKVTTRKWGSSIGVILPKKIVEQNKIKENEEITIELKKRPLSGEMFGRFPRFKGKKTAQELKDEMRKGWD